MVVAERSKEITIFSLTLTLLQKKEKKEKKEKKITLSLSLLHKLPATCPCFLEQYILSMEIAC